MTDAASGVSRSRRVEAAWLAGCVTIFAASAALASRGRVAPTEHVVFGWLNSSTVMPYALVWTVMQAGNFVAIPIATLTALLCRRAHLAVGLGLGGLAVYFLARGVKHIVDRPRPHELLADVHIRGTLATGLGYLSGHAAVVTFLVVLAAPHLPRWARPAAYVLIVAVCLARVYVGAHLPLDVLGGAAMGASVALTIRLLWPRVGAYGSRRRQVACGATGR